MPSCPIGNVVFFRFDRRNKELCYNRVFYIWIWVLYLMSSRVKELHCIMPIENISSVLTRGILSHNRSKDIQHADISMIDVQKIRDKIKVPNGMMLHDYANLYFCARNPMMFLRKNEADDLCILQISLDVTRLANVVFTDKNASSDYARFFSARDVKSKIDFDMVFADYWTDDNPIEQMKKKSAKCAEVLVPHVIPAHYVIGAYVVDENSQQKLQKQGFTLAISVKSGMFFR